jgi:hypothetical protein
MTKRQEGWKGYSKCSTLDKELLTHLVDKGFVEKTSEELNWTSAGYEIDPFARLLLMALLQGKPWPSISRSYTRSLKDAGFDSHGFRLSCRRI